jgi:hypothetical protein
MTGVHSRATTSVANSSTAHTRRQTAARLLPFVFLLYITNYLDRTSVAYAAIGMTRDLGFLRRRIRSVNVQCSCDRDFRVIHGSGRSEFFRIHPFELSALGQMQPRFGFFDDFFRLPSQFDR